MKNKKNLVVLSRYEKNQSNAGPKAKTDIETITKELFGARIVTLHKWKNSDKLARIINKIVARLYPVLKIRRNEHTLIQYPYSSDSLGVNHIKNKYYLIHDLDGIRYNNPVKAKAEVKLLDDSRAIICHNKKMKEYLVLNGISSEKIYTIEIFDYLSASRTGRKKFNPQNPTVIYAGNLNAKKSPFLNQLDPDKMSFTLNLYGIGVGNNSNCRIHYKGSFAPDELPIKISGDLGLVWDGEYDGRDENKAYKYYSKYNNPHKLSCYIAAELPVIVWEKAAIADFVKKYNIGYIISSIYEINNLDFSDYSEKLTNVKFLGRKLREGYYTKHVLQQVLKDKGAEPCF